ncbi:sigma-54-dependent transcriptional regulator [Pseudodesulfovibrio senegalensis]|uniref:DNA-binding transcriptional regulator NtrC n=1 Tax=Pseudodesulfovibrio senegalensis TaxID=1721087 RepID=A0A6N6N4A2_9BACT|nr:sigma-54 dependent transcriptional regulator [Pseudodesulfovibrio senegalensis]KAB1442906.1 sigma-54-dependent Fis family transcriptional regulator [Pseudodesulfovibrio senegalensis]
MAQILIVDDDAQLRKSFVKMLEQEGHDIRTANSGESGIAAVRESLPDLLVMDVRMPGMSGLEAFAHIRKIDQRLPVIIMTAYSTTETAIEATKMGAFDYILKPFEPAEVLNLIEQALEAGRLAREHVEMGPEPEAAPAGALVGNSRAMNEIYKAIGKAAPTDALVLIRGESGTGKELVARAVYQHSLRADKPFTVINCVAIPDTLLESELFGYERGAFTGANSRRVGKIEQADGGTVLLDEIGDMPLNIQAKILRLLQEKKIERLGGRDPIPLDVRIIAATNRDLEEAVAKGSFREDLYYRLKVVTITLPPLRERMDDVVPLAEYFLNRLSVEMDLPNPGLAPDAREFLRSYPWPGNVRELSNTMQKALIFNRGVALDSEQLARTVDAEPDTAPGQGNGDQDGQEQGFRLRVRKALAENAGKNAFEMLMNKAGKLIISEALAITDGNRTRAAKLLGMSRPTLAARIEKYDIKTSTKVE